MSRLANAPGAVIVGVDGSPDSGQAVAWAAEQAHLLERELVIVCAVGPGDTWHEAYGVDHDVLRRSLETMAADTVREATGHARAAYPDLAIRDELPFLDARLALLQLSEGAEMVVVGSRGRGPVSRLMLGSVSLAVSQHASCPVVVVRPHQERGTAGILVGVDDSGRDRAAAEFGFRMAASRHQPLTLLHCFFDGRPSGLVAADEPGVDDERLVLSEAVAGLAEDYPDVAATQQLARGLADECLLQQSRHRDLVVVAAHPTHPLRGLLSPHADRAVVEHAPCAIAVVPPPGR